MQKLPSALLGFGLLFLVLAVVFGWMIGPLIIEDQIAQQTRLYNGSYAWKKWKDPTNLMWMKFHIFNVTNPDDVSRGEKPILQELGPYVYQEKRYKVNISVDEDNDIIKYQMPVWYFFRPDLSNGTEDDLVTVINIPLVGISQRLSEFPTMIRFLLGMYIIKFKETLFIKRLAKEMIFEGYYSPMVEELQALTGEDLLPNSTVGLFYGRNGTDDGVYEVYGGNKDPLQFGEILSWRGKNELEFWSGKCNAIEGTDASLFPPFITKKSIIKVFNPDLCRSIYATYSRDIEYKGLYGYRFTAPQVLYEHISVNPDNICFCKNPEEEENGCYEKGVMTLSVCQHDAPVTVSYPHFLHAPYYQSLVDGLSPNEDDHDTFIDVEPNFGVVLRGHKRAQLNVDLRPVSGFNGFRTVPSVQFPVLWAEESFTVDEETYELLTTTFQLPMQVFKIGRWSVMRSCCLLIATAISIFIIRARKKNYHI